MLLFAPVCLAHKRNLSTSNLILPDNKLIVPSDTPSNAYVIPYELRIGDHEKYTVLVILGDYYGHHFGEPNDMTDLMSRSFHPDSNTFVASYLQFAQQWFLETLKKWAAEHPEVYQHAVEHLERELREFAPIANERTSAVIITEYKDLSKPITFMRFDPPDEEGFISSEKHFLKHEKQNRIPQPVPDFKWHSIPSLEPLFYNKEAFPLFSKQNETLFEWLQGENQEIKHFAMDHETKGKFFRYLYHTARAHNLFRWGASTFPKDIALFPDGAPIPENASNHYGVHVSHHWIGAFSDLMMRYYRRFGFESWMKINNEQTYDLDFYLMVAEAEKLDRTTTKLLKINPPAGQKVLLVYDSDFSTLVKTVPNCEVAFQALTRAREWVKAGGQ